MKLSIRKGTMPGSKQVFREHVDGVAVGGRDHTTRRDLRRDAALAAGDAQRQAVEHAESESFRSERMDRKRDSLDAAHVSRVGQGKQNVRCRV